MAEWFRSSDWSPLAKGDFEARLKRARPHNRAQYLRIKALALREAGETSGAVDLSQRITTQHADRQIEVAFAHELLGDLSRSTGDLRNAEVHYRASLLRSPDLSGTTGEVYIKLGEVVLESGSGDAHEVEALLEDARPHLRLNSSALRFHVLAARFAYTIGYAARRRRSAGAALDLVGAPAQFSRHPTVGQVKAAPELLDELRTLAE
ncbi:MAG: hypothetical protein AAGA65_09480 [Actinomycetota bacterium]